MVISYDEIYRKKGPSHWKQYFDTRGIESDYKDHANKVIRFFKDKKGRLLDVGCGDGLILAKLSENKKMDCFGIDISKVGIEIAQSKGVKNCQAIDLLEFNSQPFDYIFMGDTLEHIEDTDKALTKVYDLLKPNGVFYLASPIQDQIRPDDYHLFNKRDLDKILSKYFHITKYQKTKRTMYFTCEKKYYPLFLSNDGLDLTFQIKEPSLFIGVANFAALHLVYQANPQISYLIDIVPEQIEYFKWLLETIRKSKDRADFRNRVWDKISNTEHYPNISNIEPKYVNNPVKERDEYEMYWGYGFLQNEDSFKRMKEISKRRFEFIEAPLTKSLIDRISKIFPFHFKVIWISNLLVNSYFQNKASLLETIKLKNGVLLQDMRSPRAKTIYYPKTRSPHYDCFRIVSKYQDIRPMIEVFCGSQGRSELHNAISMTPEEFLENTDHDKGVYLHHLVGEGDVKNFQEIYQKAKKHKFIIISEFEPLKDSEGYWNNRGFVKYENH